MVSKWIEFIRSRAAETNKTYGCTLSDPETPRLYKAKYGNRKALSQSAERVGMGMEDIDAKEKPKPKSMKRLVYRAPQVHQMVVSRPSAGGSSAGGGVSQNVMVRTVKRPKGSKEQQAVDKLYGLDF